MNTANSLPAAFDGMLKKTLLCSRYAKHALETDQELLDWLHENYTMPCDRAEMLALLQQSNPNTGDEAGLARALRKLRKQAMVKLILRDLNGLADLNEVMQAMTALAEICIQQAQTCLMQAMQAQFARRWGQRITHAVPESILQAVEGKVWTWVASSEEFGKLKQTHLISNTARRSDGVHVRVVSEQKPNDDAHPVAANLEDAYLYFVQSSRIQ